MRHPVSSAAAAAIFVLASVGIGLWFSSGGATPALADYLQPLLEAKTVKYTMIIERTNASAGMTGLSAEKQKELMKRTSEVMELGAHRSRHETGVGNSKTVEIWDLRQGKQLLLEPAEKRARLIEYSQRPKDQTPGSDDRGLVPPRREPGEPAPVALFRALLLDTVRKPGFQRQSLGEKEIDGRRVVGFRMSGRGTVVDVWGDPQTRLPVRIESTSALMPDYKMTTRDFAFNVPMDESLFSLEPPAGYHVTVRQSQPGDDSPEGENDLIEMFRAYSQWSGGRFPDLLDLAWLDEIVSRAEWLTRGLAQQEKPMDKVEQEMAEARRKLQRGMTFTVLLPKQSDWHYAGRGVSLGAADRPVFWYRPKDAKTYRVVYADLSVRESDAPPHVRAVPIAQLEKDLIEMLRQYSERNGGYFPEVPDMRSVSRIASRDGQKRNDSEERQKPGAEEPKVPLWLVKLQRGVMFVGLLPKQSDWHYAGKNVRLGMAGRPVFWYRPEGAKTYRVICADLSVRESDEPPSMPDVLPEPGWPQGDCTIAGKVVAEATGKPVSNARVFLLYYPTVHRMFVNTDRGGTFRFKSIRTGPYSLRTMSTPGYQDAHYDPQHKGDGDSWPQFSLKEGEQRSDIVLKVKEACRISGRIVDENGKAPEDAKQLFVMAWFKADDGEGYESKGGVVNGLDGSYVIDGLGDKPAYVMVENQHAAKEGHGPPPVYYPGTFSRSEARLVTFEHGRSAEKVNITRRKEGGLAIAGTVRDESGRPVPEAFVLVHPGDMSGGFATAYTDPQGQYQVQGLGDGEFLVHVDAVHRGLVRTRSPIRLDKTTKKTDLNFTLHRGATISGRLVDENGRDWEVAFSFGRAIVGAANERRGFVPTSVDFRNKYRPKNSDGMARIGFYYGKGDYPDGELTFPTKSTFLVQGLKPGHTTFEFQPQKVAKILHAGQEILDSGIDTEPGQETKDITIVISSP